MRMSINLELRTRWSFGHVSWDMSQCFNVSLHMSLGSCLNVSLHMSQCVLADVLMCECVLADVLMPDMTWVTHVRCLDVSHALRQMSWCLTWLKWLTSHVLMSYVTCLDASRQMSWCLTWLTWLRWLARHSRLPIDVCVCAHANELCDIDANEMCDVDRLLGSCDIDTLLDCVMLIGYYARVISIPYYVSLVGYRVPTRLTSIPY